MSFEIIIAIICFLIELVFFIISTRNLVFVKIPAMTRLLFMFLSLVPTWGFVIVFGTAVYFYVDVKNAGPDNRIFRNSWINLKLYGKNKCKLN